MRKSRRTAKPSRKLLESRSPAVIHNIDVLSEEENLYERALTPAQEEAAIDQELQLLRLAAKKQEVADLWGKASPLRINGVLNNHVVADLLQS